MIQYSVRFLCKRRLMPQNSLSSNSASVQNTVDTLQWKQQSDAFTPLASCNIVTFNMLAPCYKRISKDSINCRESCEYDTWMQRAKATLAFLQSDICNSPTIFALQEFWLEAEYYNIFKQGFENFGYELKFLQRTGIKTDAVAFLIKKGVFDISGEDKVHLCSQSDRVALILLLKHNNTGKNILIANTHLSFPHTIFDKMIQVRQMQTLTDAMDKFAKRNNVKKTTRIILGDFNVESHSPVCDHLRESGYISCFEVCPPIYKPNEFFSSVSDTLELKNIAPSNGIYRSNKLPMESLYTIYTSTLAGVEKSTRSTTATSPEIASSAGPSVSSAIIPTSVSVKKLDPLDNAAFFQNSLAKLQKSPLNKISPHFISHHNHRQEEVGVDHIFVKPISVLSSESKPPLLRGQGGFISSMLGSKQNSRRQIQECACAALVGQLHGITQVEERLTSSEPSQAGAIQANMSNLNSLLSLTNFGPIDSLSVSSSSPSSAAKVADATQGSCIAQLSHTSLSSKSETPVVNPGSIEQTLISVASTITTTVHSNIVDIDDSDIFVDKTCVLPESLNFDCWHQSFQISDHRPISTTLIIGKKKSD